jgi:hypothetical protein
LPKQFSVVSRSRVAIHNHSKREQRKQNTTDNPMQCRWPDRALNDRYDVRESDGSTKIEAKRQNYAYDHQWHKPNTEHEYPPVCQGPHAPLFAPLNYE